MTTCLSIRLFAEHTITAYAFAAQGKAWVGLADEPATHPTAWARIWSSHGTASQADISALLRRLTDELRLETRPDPTGAGPRTIVAGHYFFDDWEYWGQGNPAPLLPNTATHYTNEARTASLEDLAHWQPPDEEA